MTDPAPLNQQPKQAHSGKSLFGSKSLWIALIVTLFGAATWVYSAATKSVTATGNSAGVSASGGEVSSFSQQAVGETQEPRRLIDDSAPATVRYGASFIVAFLIAFVLKKVIKSVLLIAGLLIGAIVTLKHFGFLNYDWNSAQIQVEHGVELARTEGEKYRSLVMGYLPSGLSAGAGAIFGAKRG